MKSAGAGFRAAGEDIFEILSKFRQRCALLLAMGIVKPDTRHFSSAEAKANGLMEGLYPLTPGRLGGHGLLHDGSPDAQRVDDLLCAVLHPLGDSPSETGRIHAVPGSGMRSGSGRRL